MNISEESAIFWHELGLAISQWTFVESGIFKVVSTCVSRDDRAALGYAMFAIENFRSKLAFADAIMERKIADEKHLAEWQSLSDRIRRLAAKRNNLAHYRVVLYEDERPGRRVVIEKWPADRRMPKGPEEITTAAQLKKVMTPRPKESALSVRDVAAIRSEFFRAARLLDNLHAALKGLPIPYKEASAPVGSPPTIRELRNQIREALELPQKPSRR